jgi:hypothetical protein
MSNSQHRESGDEMTIIHDGPVTLEEAKRIIRERGYTVREDASFEDIKEVHASSVERRGPSAYGPPACMVLYSKRHGNTNTAICI